MSLTIREALAQGHLYCAFQPLVDLSTGQIFGYESLARSTAESYPDAQSIITGAIQQHCCGELGRALRGMSVAQCPHSPLFLNMHPHEFREGWLVRPDDPLSSHDQPIYLEITESVPLSHYRYCHSVLDEIRHRGVKIVVDDLGAGYSNLKYIVDLQPDVVKLDRALISGITPGGRRHRLIESIVDLCHSQGAQVVAEGIETATELRVVWEAGVHYAQGFYLAYPSKTPTVTSYVDLLRDALQERSTPAHAQDT